MATVMHALERFLPVLSFTIPGAKLGLANIFTLVTINIFGVFYGFVVAITRTFLAALITGNFGPPFILSISGAIFSTLVMGILVYLFKGKISNIGVSIVGAIAHNVAQLFAVTIILKSLYFYSYLPYLLLFAIPTGVFVGATTNYMIKILAKIIKLQEK